MLFDDNDFAFETTNMKNINDNIDELHKIKSLFSFIKYDMNRFQENIGELKQIINLNGKYSSEFVSLYNMFLYNFIKSISLHLNIANYYGENNTNKHNRIHKLNIKSNLNKDLRDIKICITDNIEVDELSKFPERQKTIKIQIGTCAISLRFLEPNSKLDILKNYIDEIILNNIDTFNEHFDKNILLVDKCILQMDLLSKYIE
jgi:hypothetical protein